MLYKSKLVAYLVRTAVDPAFFDWAPGLRYSLAGDLVNCIWKQAIKPLTWDLCDPTNVRHNPLPPWYTPPHPDELNRISHKLTALLRGDQIWDWKKFQNARMRENGNIAHDSGGWKCLLTLSLWVECSEHDIVYVYLYDPKFRFGALGAFHSCLPGQLRHMVCLKIVALRANHGEFMKALGHPNERPVTPLCPQRIYRIPDEEIEKYIDEYIAHGTFPGYLESILRNGLTIDPEGRNQLMCSTTDPLKKHNPDSIIGRHARDLEFAVVLLLNIDKESKIYVLLS